MAPKEEQERTDTLPNTKDTQQTATLDRPTDPLQGGTSCLNRQQMLIAHRCATRVLHSAPCGTKQAELQHNMESLESINQSSQSPEYLHPLEIKVPPTIINEC